MIASQSRRSGNIRIQQERIGLFTRLTIDEPDQLVASSEYHTILPHSSRTIDVVARREMADFLASFLIYAIHEIVVATHHQCLSPLELHHIGRCGYLPFCFKTPQRIIRGQ